MDRAQPHFRFGLGMLRTLARNFRAAGLRSKLNGYGIAEMPPESDISISILAKSA
jgi:hypothetical protein